MKIKIHLLTSDTNDGLHTEVFTSARAMYERLIEMHDLDADVEQQAKYLLDIELAGASSLPEADQESLAFDGDLFDLLDEHRRHMDSFNYTDEVIDIEDFEKYQN